MRGGVGLERVSNGGGGMWEEDYGGRGGRGRGEGAGGRRGRERWKEDAATAIIGREEREGRRTGQLRRRDWRRETVGFLGFFFVLGVGNLISEGERS